MALKTGNSYLVKTMTDIIDMSTMTTANLGFATTKSSKNVPSRDIATVTDNLPLEYPY